MLRSLFPWILALSSLAGFAATPAPPLQTAPGFTLELLHQAPTNQGSWITLTSDPQGRLIAAPQGREPLQRITCVPGQPVRLEPLDLPFRATMGLLCAFDSLYLNGQGPQGLGLYRAPALRESDSWGPPVLIRKWEGDGGEHGPHGLVAGADGKLYVVNGNFVNVPTDLLPTSPARNYADDRVLPRLEDPRGVGRNRKPPGGHIVRLDPDGSRPELFSVGQRNAYDLAFNADGELFVFDSDMEGDWGLPWYRPNRILHCFPGADHGYREGSAKWPEWYADGQPAVLNLGLGSPTGVASAQGLRFPARFRSGLVVADWSYGRILAIPLEPQGASYRGKSETLVQGRPLNLTDLSVGSDGALYFITGGRGIRSALYRLSHSGPQDLASAPVASSHTEARKQRRALEQVSGTTDPSELTPIWSGLASVDPTLRLSARLALERLPVGEWKDRALGESNVTAGLTALLGLARTGSAADQPALLKAISRWPLDSLDAEHFLLKLRVIEVALARHGVPGGELRQRAQDKLGRQFPARTWPANQALVSLLVAVDSPEVVAQALDLRDAATSQSEAIHYQTVLRRARSGWTPALRQRYFTWFHRRPMPTFSEAETRWFTDLAFKPTSGASVEGYLRNIRQEAVAALSDEDKGELAPWITGAAATGAPAPPAGIRPPRAFVQRWKASQLEARWTPAGRDVARGRQVYAEAQCAACHRLGDAGGAIGPDLTGVGARYSPADLIRSLVEPSAVVSDLYRSTVLTLKDGSTVTGRIESETDREWVVKVDPLANRLQTVQRAGVVSREISPVSPMPDGLLDTFTEAEILDLVAYLQRPTP
jgi:putative heme-binding domain-containing protein